MSQGQLKPGWRRMKFGEVVKQVKDRVNPQELGLERFIAGEHMDTDDLGIRRWGDIGDNYLGPAFHMRFKPGQVLYGSRRTYLRKVAVPDFEGICANTTFVLEPHDPEVLLPELLPFIMQTKAFHEHSIKQSRGSVNPYVNFSDLAWYEFALPPLEEQSQILAVLRDAEAVVEARRALAKRSQLLFRASIDAVFHGQIGLDNIIGRKNQRSSAPEHWQVYELFKVTKKIVDGVHRRPKYVESGIPFLTVENLTEGSSIDFSTTRYISEEDHNVFIRRAHPEPGDVLVTKDGTLGVARVVENAPAFSIFVSLALLKPDKSVLDPWFLRYYFDSSIFLRSLAGKTSGSAIKHIHLIDFRKTKISLPPLEDQAKLSAIIRQFDDAFFSALQSVQEAVRFKGALSSTIFGVH